MKFKQTTLKNDLAQCLECKRILERGQLVVIGFKRDETGLFTKKFCTAECLADYKEKRQSAKERAFNRLSIQFN